MQLVDEIVLNFVQVLEYKKIQYLNFLRILSVQAGYKKGLFAAAEVIETEGKKAGISDANMELIKAKILGLKVVSDE